VIFDQGNTSKKKTPMSQDIKPNSPQEKEEKVESVERVESEGENKSAEKTSTGVHFRELVPGLHKWLSQGDYHDKNIMSEVQSLMEQYDEKLGDWQRFAVAEEEEGKYSRNLIARNKYFTLMLLCWPPKAVSPIHDHGGSECWLRVVQGALEERYYEKPTENAPLVRKSVKQHSSPSVCFINDGLGLHSIANPSATETAISLHCYVPGYDVCHAYLDEESSAKKKQCFLSFTSVDGKKVTH